MVMVDDPKLRRERLALLTDLRDEMNQVADISKLAA
jgi:glycyl-tRNA synthetase beta subunit